MMYLLRGSLILVFCILLVSSICLAEDITKIDITLSNNDIVTEDITLMVDINESYDTVEFTTQDRPLSVSYDGTYTIEKYNETYYIILTKDIIPGKNIIEFSVTYDKIIEKGETKVFRTSFFPYMGTTTNISVRLPLYHVLSDKEPSATPKPTSITSDGQHIQLGWKFQDEEQIDIVVFYLKEKSSKIVYIIFVAILILLSVGIYLFFRRKTKKDISGILSTEEIKVINELRKDVTNQKDISKNLDFSKSKMSKVVRKLEEKELIEKKPYFKTNILKLSRKIK